MNVENPKKVAKQGREVKLRPIKHLYKNNPETENLI